MPIMPDRNPWLEIDPPCIKNVVATFSLSRKKLDLKKIAVACRNAEYNPARFPAVVMRIQSPKATAMIFGTGKIVVTGASSERTAM